MSIAYNQDKKPLAVSAKLASLEGLRGIASLSVVFHHFFYGFLPALIWGEVGSKGLIWPKFEEAVAQTPLNLLWSGDFAVMVFFVMSAYVLTYRYFQNYDHNIGKSLQDDGEFLLFSVIRRYPRLTVPIFFSSLCVLFFFNFGLLYHKEAVIYTHSFEWLSFLWDLPSASLADVFRNTFIEVTFAPETRYNNVLWTICIEFYGSMLAFALIGLTGRLPWRWIIYPLVIWWIGNSPYVGFVLGVVLADLRFAPSCTLLRNWLERPVVSWSAGLTGLYLGSFIKGIDCSQSNWFSWLYLLDGGSMPNAQWTHNWGAFLLLTALLSSPSWQRGFSNRFFVWLGRISFAMYLMHSLVLGTLSAWIVATLGPTHSYGEIMALTIPLTLATVFVISHLFAKYIDEPNVRFGRILCKKLLQAQLKLSRMYLSESCTWLKKTNPTVFPTIVAETQSCCRVEFKIVTALIACLYIFLYSSLNQGILSHNALDSYTLQAQAWWHGKIALDQDYSYLELAHYKNHVYVSFPPTPTLPQFLLFPFFGSETPNNLLNTIYALTGFYLAARLLQTKTSWKGISVPITAVFGSSLLPLSVNGGVWFQAQLLSFVLTTLAFLLVYQAKNSTPRIHLGYLCLALSVGCRPFQALYFPILIWIVNQSNDSRGVNNAEFTFYLKSKNAIIRNFKFFLLPCIIGAIFARYNWARFDNPLEFGHIYLPEFQSAELGQFNLNYIPKNILNSLQLPFLTEDGRLSFPRFNGMLFFLANPIILIYFFKLNQWKRQQTGLNVLIITLTLIHVLLLLSHRTMGGWQFGNRYFADIIPALLLFLRANDFKASNYDILLCFLGVSLNVYGTLWLFLDWP